MSRQMCGAVVAAALAVSVAACGAADGVARPDRASATGSGQPGRTVLVLTQTLGYHHASIPWAVDAVRSVAARDGRYRVVFVAGASRLTRPR